VFGKVLAKRPDDRYQTATAFVQDLEYCLGAWFGALGGEQTIAIAPGEVTVTNVPPAPAPEPEEETVVLPPVAAVAAAAVAPAPAAAPSPVPAAPPAAAAAALVEDSPSTVVIKAPAVRPAPEFAEVDEPDSETVVLQPPPAPPPRPEARVEAAAPSTAPVEDTPATIVMKAPPLASPADVGMETESIARPSPAAAAPAAPAPRAPSPPQRAAPPARPAAPAVPEPEEDGTVRIQIPPTVRMQAPDVSAPPPDEVTMTVRMPAPAPQAPRTAPVLPAQPKADAAPKTPPRPAAPPPVPTEPPSYAPPPPAPTLRTAVPGTDTVPGAQPPPRPSRSGIAPALVLGGGLIALVLGAVAAVILFRSSVPEAPVADAATPPPQVATPVPPPPPSSAPPSLAPARGVLHVETVPAGATISVNGEARGVAPLDVGDLDPGDYDLKVELRGYEPKTQKVTIPADELRADLKLSLTRLAPAGGTADVLSTPFGAAVIVDGAKVGETPLTSVKMRPGSRKVEVQKDGYEPWSGTLTVEAGKKAKLDVSLKAVVRATPVPAPTVEAVDTSRVYNNVPSEVDTVARKASGASPSYPSNAPRLRSGDGVSVSVALVVTETGEVKDPQIVESGGKIVDEAVLTAVKAWKYTPAVKRGIPVKVRLTVRQTFRAG
jgi:TonB family protein